MGSSESGSDFAGFTESDIVNSGMGAVGGINVCDGIDEKPVQLPHVNLNDDVIVISDDDEKDVVKMDQSFWQKENVALKDENRRLRIHCRALQNHILNPNYDIPVASSTQINHDQVKMSPREFENDDKENGFW